jgi:RecB family exonuclease/superfamily I DNA/RNA helicase
MPLTLVTGPANAAKAGEVLGRFNAALPLEPLLVVPTAADSDHYARELAEAGIVLGAEVATFDRLVRRLAAATSVEGRVIGRVARARVLRSIVDAAELKALARSATSPGFADALGTLFEELGGSLVAPPRFARAVADWPGAPPHAAELASLYLAYHRRLDRLKLTDRESLARAVLDALRRQPAAWGGRPVFLYGFDDLTPLQLDAVETLARRAGAEVCVALPWEPGRAAFAGRAGTVETLRPLADEHVHLQDRSEHYAGRARGALHHLERRLFEPGAEQVPPNGAVRLLEAGGERAEAELVAASVLELLGRGMAPEDVAVLVRGGAGAAGVLARGLADAGVPVTRERITPLARTRLGAGVLAGARAALPGGTAADLLRWLRTPGRWPDADALDAFDGRLSRGEVSTAARARAAWPEGPHPFAALDAIAAAAGEGPAELLAALEAEAQAIWTAPHLRRAEVLGPGETEDALAARALRAASSELRGLAATDPRLAGDTRELLEALGAVEVRERPAPGGVLLADPLAVRARRFRAVFVCGLQDAEFPRRPTPEPFLDDDARADLARTTGLVLPHHEDVLARERYLLYACVSRPEEVLFLSFRSSDEEGDPLVASPFLDDVRELFTDALWEQRGRRLLAHVTWPPSEAPTPHELRRARAALQSRPDPPPLGPPETEAVQALLAGHELESARGLEAFAGCGVRWLVDRLLRPRRTDPDPEAMRRGSLAHAALERVLDRLRERTGSAALGPVSLPAALEALEGVMGELRATAGGVRARAGLRSLAADLERYLRHEAATGAGLEPERLEWSFGGEGDAQGPLPLPGAGLSVTGRVDRIDLGAGIAIVRDYKGKAAPPAAKWAEDHQLQVALYALAARELLGLDVAGALYQPLGARDVRPRGAVRDDVPGSYVAGDRLDPEAFAAVLDVAREAAVAAARDLRAGRIRACPGSCTPRGCAHPGICRAGEEAQAQAAAAAAARSGAPA